MRSVDAISSQNVNWTFSGSGTAADPWKAVSPTLDDCWNNEAEITAENGTFQIKSSTNSQLWLNRMLIETW